MKKNILPFLLISSLITLQGCAAIEGIFKAGMWIGILAVLLVAGLLFWLFSKMRK